MMNEIYSSLTPWQRVQLARHPERPYTLDYIEHMFTNFVELSGDRRFRDDKAIVGGFAKFQGKPVMVIGTQKGRDMKSNVYRNFGWPSPEGYRKALRLMQLAEKAEVPIVTFIDTPGAFPASPAKSVTSAEAIAVNLRDMFNLRVPVVSVIIGEGGSGGAIGIGVGNRILIMENAYYSVITPKGAPRSCGRTANSRRRRRTRSSSPRKSCFRSASPMKSSRSRSAAPSAITKRPPNCSPAYSPDT